MSLPEFRRWADVPDDLKTKTQLGKLGLKPAKGQKAAAIKISPGWSRPDYDLYDVADAVAKRTCSAAQLAALEKARLVSRTCKKCKSVFSDSVSWRALGSRSTKTCWSCYNQKMIEKEIALIEEREESEKEQKQDAILWSRNVLADKKAVILDTETTGLSGVSEIIEIAMIDTSGRVLFNSRVKPIGKIQHEAFRVHGVKLEDLADAPSWDQIHGQVTSLIENASRVVVYNAEFDHRLLNQTAVKYDLREFSYDKFECAMLKYAEYYGEWSSYHADFKWQKLDGGDHTALGDCRATLDLLQNMR